MLTIDTARIFAPLLQALPLGFLYWVAEIDHARPFDSSGERQSSHSLSAQRHRARRFSFRESSNPVRLSTLYETCGPQQHHAAVQ
jgi:hypothetical protein